MKRVTKTIQNVVALAAASGMVSAWAATDPAPAAQREGSPARTNAGRPSKVGFGDLETVIVTAQRRAQESQDVPISISVLSSKALEASPSLGVNDVLKRVAGVTSYETQQGGMAKFNIRGVASNSSLFNGASTVGYYLDEIPFGFVKFPISPDASGYDLDRVEILRGPQGTLYGANALNGVIRVMTKDANLQSFEAKARATLSTTEDGGENHREDFMINVPLVQDKLAARAVVGYGDYSGWIDQPITGREDVNDAEVKNLRLKINGQPTDSFKVGLLGWWSRDDRGAPPVSFADRTVPTRTAEPVSTDFDAFSLTAVYDLPVMSILSSTSYMDFQNVGILNTPPTGSEQLFTDLRAKVKSEEVRITSNAEGNWRWSLGGIYREEEDLLAQALLVGFPGQLVATEFTSDSFAAFGELTRVFFDGTVELTAGLRYFEDSNKSIDRSFIAPLPGQQLLTAKADSHATTPRVVLNWLPTDNLTLYASYSEGFRSGFTLQGAQIEILPPGFPSSVQPDELHNYEVGAKGNVFDRRFTYDVAVYFIDWQDTVQRLGIINRFGLTTFLPLNAESASGLGIDFAQSFALTDSFTVGTTASWNDLTFDSDVLSGPAVLFRKGSRLDESPEWTAGVTMDYSVDFGSHYNFSVSSSATYYSEMLTRSATLARRGDNILTAQLALTIAAPRWSATLFGDNVTDEDGVVRPTLPPNLHFENRLRPRTIGVQFDYRY